MNCIGLSINILADRRSFHFQFPQSKLIQDKTVKRGQKKDDDGQSKA